MYLNMLTPPACEPITLDEVKAWNRVDTTADDALITRAIIPARKLVETRTHRQLVCATYEYDEDDFPWIGGYTGRPWDEYKLPRPPLIGIDSIQYYPPLAGAALTTLDASFYDVDTGSTPGRFHLAFAKWWPAVRPQINAVKMIFRCGHLTPFTANITTGVIALNGRNPVALERLVFRSIGLTGALPASLVAGTVYYPVNISGATCQLSTDGATPITLTTAGSGTLFVLEGADKDAEIEVARQAIAMLVGGAYNNRESEGELQLRPNDAFDRLVRSIAVADMEV